jgi:phage tail-like protein
MATDRQVPYPNFNFAVGFDSDERFFGGFSDVSGLMTELTMAEYRNGNDLENNVRKIQGIHKASDVTLKRGLIDSGPLWDWIRQSRTDGPKAKKDVTVTVRDEAGNPVQKWTLSRALPLKWTGPTLAGKGGGDVAMEELVLSIEAIDYTPVP